MAVFDSNVVVISLPTIVNDLKTSTFDAFWVLMAGGVLTATRLIGWRAIFLVNVPIGIFATVWAYGQLHELSSPLRGEKLDPIGNVTFAGGLTLFLLGLTLGALAGFDIGDYGLMLVGLLWLVAFVLVERRITNPMMDISLFKNRMFAGGILGNFSSAWAGV